MSRLLALIPQPYRAIAACVVIVGAIVASIAYERPDLIGLAVEVAPHLDGADLIDSDTEVAP